MNAAEPGAGGEGRGYGTGPYAVLLVHGGPGAAGGMAPVARRIQNLCPVYEPFQTALSFNGQVDELSQQIGRFGKMPVILAGHSWGAWLVLALAARYPQQICKAILVGCGGLRPGDGRLTHARRMARLGPGDSQTLQRFTQALPRSGSDTREAHFAAFGHFMSRVDAFDPMDPEPGTETAFRPDMYEAVWPEGNRLRETGGLLCLAEKVECPVTAVHGDVDPHPAEGVRDPLMARIRDFRFILLEKCGHKPWMEKQARERFYALLKQEVETALFQSPSK